MAEIKWIKITTNMFDDEKIKLIDAMPESDTIFYIWIHLLTQAGKCNAGGYIFLSEHVPYTDEMLSTIFNRPVNSVRLALKTLKDFGMIKRSENNDIKITNWEKHQNIEGMEKVREQNRLRKQKQRAESKKLKATSKDVTSMSRDSHAIELEQELDKELDIDKEKEITTTTSSNSKNVLHHFEKCGFGLLSPVLIEKILADIKMYGSEWVTEAATIADENGAHRYSYVKGILENWKAKGKSNRKEAKHEPTKRDTFKPEDEGQGVTI